MSGFYDRQRDLLADLPADDPLVLAEHRRLVAAIEQVHHSAHLLGLDPVEAYVPFSVRADAWLYRVERERRAWAGFLAVPRRRRRAA